MLEALLDSPEYADVLQDRYVTVRGDRFVLPVKAQAKGLGLGIVHDASRTEKTVFVEPASVVPVGNQRRMAEAALRDEERRILGRTLGAARPPRRARCAPRWSAPPRSTWPARAPTSRQRSARCARWSATAGSSTFARRGTPSSR